MAHLFQLSQLFLAEYEYVETFCMRAYTVSIILVSSVVSSTDCQNAGRN